MRDNGIFKSKTAFLVAGTKLKWKITLTIHGVGGEMALGQISRLLAFMPNMIRTKIIFTLWKVN